MRQRLEAMQSSALRVAGRVPPVSAWRARSDSTSPAVRFSRRARSLIARRTSSSSVSVVRTHLMLMHHSTRACPTPRRRRCTAQRRRGLRLSSWTGRTVVFPGDPRTSAAVSDASDASDAERLAHVLSQTEARVTRELEKVLAQENCSVEQWRALALLADGRTPQHERDRRFCAGLGVLTHPVGRPAGRREPCVSPAGSQ